MGFFNGKAPEINGKSALFRTSLKTSFFRLTKPPLTGSVRGVSSHDFYVLSNAGGGVRFSTIELTSADRFLGFRCFQKVCSIYVKRESIFVVSLQFCEIKKIR